MLLLNTSASPENLKYNLLKLFILNFFLGCPLDDFSFLVDRLILIMWGGGLVIPLLHHFCEKKIFKYFER